jgi:aromatic ring-opening dioxygenase LigB subunit
MPIVLGAITPHGFDLIPMISEDAGGAMQTRQALEELGRRATAAQPDVIVIATPHGIRAEGHIAVSVAGRGAGEVRQNGKQVEMNVPIDLEFARQIADRSEQHSIPIARMSAAGNRTSQSAFPLDWGVVVPLWFLGQHRHTPGGSSLIDYGVPTPTGLPVVVAAPSRDLPRDQMVEFGRAVAEAANASDKRVVFVASCDWAHTHDPNGPYGANPAAKRVDNFVVQCIKDGDLLKLNELTQQDTEEAAIDGLWQTLMLAGVQQVTPMDHELLSYEVPSYFGMIVAGFAPTNA